MSKDGINTLSEITPSVCLRRNLFNLFLKAKRSEKAMHKRSTDVSEKGVLICAVIEIGSLNLGNVGKEYFRDSNESSSPPIVILWIIVNSG